MQNVLHKDLNACCIAVCRVDEFFKLFLKADYVLYLCSIDVITFVDYSHLSTHNISQLDRNLDVCRLYILNLYNKFNILKYFIDKTEKV